MTTPQPCEMGHMMKPNWANADLGRGPMSHNSCPTCDDVATPGCDTCEAWLDEHGGGQIAGDLLSILGYSCETQAPNSQPTTEYITDRWMKPRLKALVAYVVRARHPDLYIWHSPEGDKVLHPREVTRVTHSSPEARA